MFDDTTLPSSVSFANGSCFDPGTNQCQTIAYCPSPGWVIPVSSLITVQKPNAPPGTAPYHPEFVP